MQTSDFMIRQGDVLIVKVNGLPEASPRPAKRGNVILAEGEVTGHCHYVPATDAVAIDPDERLRRIAEEFGLSDSRALVAGLRVSAPTTLWHGTPVLDPAGPCDADHDAIALPVGDYVVVQPREYTGEDEFVRVVD